MPDEKEFNPAESLDNLGLPKFEVPVLNHRMSPEQYMKFADACGAEAAKGGTLGQILTAGYNVARFFIPLPPK